MDPTWIEITSYKLHRLLCSAILTADREHELTRLKAALRALWKRAEQLQTSDTRINLHAVFPLDMIQGDLPRTGRLPQGLPDLVDDLCCAAAYDASFRRSLELLMDAMT